MDAALAGVARAGLGARVSRETSDHPDTDRIIAKVHSADYERALEHAARAGLRDFVSGDNPMSSQTFAAARTAVGAALTAAEEMMQANGNRPFVVPPPPRNPPLRPPPTGLS